VVTIERKGSDNLAKSGATTVDHPNLGQSPRMFTFFLCFILVAAI